MFPIISVKTAECIGKSFQLSSVWLKVRINTNWNMDIQTTQDTFLAGLFYFQLIKIILVQSGKQTDLSAFRLGRCFISSCSENVESSVDKLITKFCKFTEKCYNQVKRDAGS